MVNHPANIVTESLFCELILLIAFYEPVWTYQATVSRRWEHSSLMVVQIGWLHVVSQAVLKVNVYNALFDVRREQMVDSVTCLIGVFNFLSFPETSFVLI